MKRMLLTAALLVYAMFALAACCCPLQLCGLLSSIPTGILLVQQPADTDTALVSDQTPVYAAPQSTAEAPMPF